ncbi:isoamylase early set domain-containing protein [Aliiglaciecola sp. CAU 1673]|uniref:isoamylase early set domain-containing protein n=1 Tax=Aliiglaciecola sp. CAU 1673 TaxID=3032595 RepID=UPI0023DB3548|nr:isoamylase early set domain-containing protein [Aliiglaciecola sp. CAU 1673]MDF2177224.1 isoamylase early set domain-containing protein [Aliiglaciecola sp. CAU 1673]
MSFKKQYLKSKPVCKVTFKLTKKEAHNAESVYLVGDFNHWDTKATELKRLKNGDFTATVELPTDHQYQFRYLLDGKTWENDWNADQYIPSPVSFDDNSVIRV